MKISLLATLTLLSSAAAMTTHAADIKNVNSIQQKNCMICHDYGIYTRENRFIKYLPGLRTQVQRCESTLGLNLFDEDVDDVTDYLKNQFYKFK